MPTFITLVVLIAIGVLSSGCGSAASSTNASNVNAPANTAKKEDPEPTDTKPVEPAETNVGSLATPTDTYKAAYELRKNKDVAGLKKIMSDDIKEFFTMIGEAEKKSLDDMILEMCEKPQADRAEARNEKISGDTATVEYLTEKGDWKTMDFEKVDGKWLMGFPKSGKPEAGVQK